MSLTIEQLRAAFKKDENQQQSRPNNYYPFWNMNIGEQAIVRFLPDKNQDNPFGFMVEKLMHSLEINGENKTVPCLKMYGEECPICKVSSAFYKEKDEVNGKKYWRKKQHIVQALVVEDPLPADPETKETHEGKVRFLNLSYQIYNVIKEAFESGELDDVPFAYEGGCNFIIKKTKQGEHATYAVGSKFARRSSDLTEDEISFVDDNIIELDSLLPQNPGYEKVESMLEAALTGASYEESTGAASTTSTDSSSTSDNDNSSVSTTTESSTTTSATEDEYDEDADAILAQIRARRQNQ